MEKYPKHSKIISTDYSFDSASDIISEKEEENKILFGKKEYIFSSKEEKLISSDDEECLSKKYFIPPDFFSNKEKKKDFFLKKKTENNILNKTIDNQSKLRKKRGRHRLKNSSKSVHSSKDFDNLHRKIKVHFMTFLIDFLNDALLAEYGFPSFTFKQKNYKSKNKVNFEETYKMKHNSIKEMLNLEISGKFSTYDKSVNKELLSNIKSSWLDKLFQMKCLELFNLYYNNGEPLRKIVFENKEIIISKKTKSFYYLLEKYKDSKQIIIDTAKIVYLNDIDNNGKIFSIMNKSTDEKKGLK